MPGEEAIFRAPRGTRDLLPPESLAWQALARLALDEFARAGYLPVETPVFEHTEVFERGVGETTEVVGKQMYTFVDRAGRSLTLRPEGTAPVVRAVLEARLERGALPIKLAYAGPMFRQERPQKGRYRQFFQLGIEALGGDAAAIDAEVIEVGDRFLRAAGVQPSLLLNSIGHPDPSCRHAYVALLTDYLTSHEADLAADDRARMRTNPLRTFDSKEAQTAEVMRAAPLISDHLCDDCRAHFEQVQALLQDLDVKYTLDPRLVRGLDYYTRTTFEYVAGSLGAQNAVGGGGRYDGLSEALGGPALPSIGFALGLDRIVLARAADEPFGGLDVYVVAITDDAQATALKLATDLRREGIAADLDFSGRSLKGQLKDAARSGARWAAIIGSDEVEAGEATVKHLATGDQQRVAFPRLAEHVAQ